MVTKEGISVVPEKIKAIEDWLDPKDVTDVWSFMGIISYYRRLIEGFSRIANPITSLQNKGKKFDWNQKCEDSFKKLKTLLTSAPILRHYYISIQNLTENSDGAWISLFKLTKNHKDTFFLCKCGHKRRLSDGYLICECSKFMLMCTECSKFVSVA